MGEEQAQHVVGLGDGADGRARVAHRVARLQRHRRQDVAQLVDRRPLHLLQELPGVGRHRLDEPPLALGEDGVEGERRLAGPRGPGDHRHPAVRHPAVDALQVVGAGASDFDGWAAGHGVRKAGARPSPSGYRTAASRTPSRMVHVTSRPGGPSYARRLVPGRGGRCRLSIVGSKIGRIRVKSVLGRGGMGEVYVGHDETLDRQVALKSIRAGHRLSAQAKARLRPRGADPARGSTIPTSARSTTSSRARTGTTWCSS